MPKSAITRFSSPAFHGNTTSNGLPSVNHKPTKSAAFMARSHSNLAGRHVASENSFQLISFPFPSIDIGTSIRHDHSSNLAGRHVASGNSFQLIPSNPQRYGIGSSTRHVASGNSFQLTQRLDIGSAIIDDFFSSLDIRPVGLQQHKLYSSKELYRMLKDKTLERTPFAIKPNRVLGQGAYGIVYYSLGRCFKFNKKVNGLADYLKLKDGVDEITATVHATHPQRAAELWNSTFTLLGLPQYATASVQIFAPEEYHEDSIFELCLNTPFMKGIPCCTHIFSSSGGEHQELKNELLTKLKKSNLFVHDNWVDSNFMIITVNAKRMAVPIDFDWVVGMNRNSFLSKNINDFNSVGKKNRASSGSSS